MTTTAQRSTIRSIILGLLIAWLVKLHWFVIGYRIYRARPLIDDFFPAPMQVLWLAGLWYLLPLGIALWGLARRSPQLYQLTLGAFALSSLCLLLHQATYNDATFVTTMWTAAIALWFARRPCADPNAPAKLAQLTQMLIGMLFIGGFAGKLTPGYLSGATLHEIYFVARDHWSFNLARSVLEPDQLPVAAMAYSHFVLVCEALLASLPLWPARRALPFAMIGLIGLTLLNNFLLLSVVLGPLTLAACAMTLLRMNRSTVRTTPPPASLRATIDESST